MNPTSSVCLCGIDHDGEQINVKPSARRVTIAEVTAAMVTVVAKMGADHTDVTSTLLSPDGSCIQGAMLQVLGILKPDMGRVGGNHSTVMTLLGWPMVSAPYTEGWALQEALWAAQRDNDSRMPWGKVVADFEAVLAERLALIEDMEARRAEEAERSRRLTERAMFGGWGPFVKPSTPALDRELRAILAEANRVVYNTDKVLAFANPFA